MAAFFIPLEPVPASRPRVTRWGTYHLPKYKQWLKDVVAYLPGLDEVLPRETDVLVYIESIITRARTSKLSRPRGDSDNYAKGVLDAITHAGTYWDDDDQVTDLIARKRFAAPGEQAGTFVRIFAL